jgi:hypothetical protein
LLELAKWHQKTVTCCVCNVISTSSPKTYAKPLLINQNGSVKSVQAIHSKEGEDIKSREY